MLLIATIHVAIAQNRPLKSPDRVTLFKSSRDSGFMELLKDSATLKTVMGMINFTPICIGYF